MSIAELILLMVFALLMCRPGRSGGATKNTNKPKGPPPPGMNQ